MFSDVLMKWDVNVKALNEEIVTQKYRSRELYSAARRLSRDSSFSEDQEAIDELEALRQKTEDMAKSSSQQLSLLEQSQPLVELFWQTRENLLVFFDQFEKEIEVESLPPADDLGEVKLRQDTIQVHCLLICFFKAICYFLIPESNVLTGGQKPTPA